MTALKTALPNFSSKISSLTAKTSLTTLMLRHCIWRSVSFLSEGRGSLKDPSPRSLTSSVLLPQITPVFTQQARSYKVKVQLRRRCEGCYFEKRFGRLFVECSLKPRHKQMQKISKNALYKDDYSKGPWVQAAHWKYRTDRFYRTGRNEYLMYNWLEGRLGTDI